MFSLIYNFNPLRLKRYALLSTFVLGLITVICVLVGFISTKSLLLFDFPTKYALLVLVFVTLCFGIKDLKDIKGDKLHKVLSLPVLLGEGKARIIFSLFVAISYFLAAILTGSGILFLLAFAFSISNFLLLVKLRSNELPIILSYFVFSIFFCFFALF
jgi:4-hydroxybenzoate polyprenyltransferase